jgi:hypothetical protein
MSKRHFNDLLVFLTISRVKIGSEFTRNLSLKVAIEASGMLDDRYEFVELDRPGSDAGNAS